MNTSKNISAAELQVRKLSLIEWLARLDDVTAIKEIEAIQKKRRIAKNKQLLDNMSAKASANGLTQEKLEQLLKEND